MTIASFHEQVHLAGGHPLLGKLNVLQSAEALRSLLKEPGDRAFPFWTIWS
jgi:hypothetical protein